MRVLVHRITEGTNGAQLSRHAWKYSSANDTWQRLADVPLHVEHGGTVVLRDRYILLLGSTHGKNSFRVGMNEGADSSAPGRSVGPPGMRLGGGIVTYYGDDVLCYDTKLGVYSRIGTLLYGVITGHWGTNGTHVIGVGGEPRHGWNGNTETVVQIGKISWSDHLL